MVALKDPEIKLFGMTISLPSVHPHPHLPPPPLSDVTCQELQPPPPRDQEPSEEEELEGKEEESSHQRSEGLKDPTIAPSQSTSPSASPGVSVDKETSSPRTPKEGEQSESQEKTLKKPDKILPCPRCNSMDTKFCYYNNYNVNQPRHFCKNCQRYWTAGGTMRNVPVGAGRRKNKNSTATASSHYRHIMVSEALHQSARASGANGIRHATLGTNGTVLNFGSDGPLCESMASALNLADKRHNCLQTGSENGGDDHSTITLANSAEKGGLQEPVGNNFQGFPPHVPCFPGATWSSYSWNSAIPPTAFCPPGFPISYYPAPTYWGCTLPESWNSPILGKHSRDGEVLNPAKTRKEDHQKENTPESGVWIPKTLRIDDPNEAAKSSIWTTLGIKNDIGRSNGVVSLLKAFQSKGDKKKHTSDMSPVLQANPAALSRSLNFHERA